MVQGKHPWLGGIQRGCDTTTGIRAPRALRSG